MMTNQPPTEKWMPLQCIAGECSLSRMEYDATNLLVELDSFLEKRVIKVVFSDVFSYRVTLEHFRWADFVDTPKTKSTLVRVVNSNFVKWLEAAGAKQLYGNTLDIAHYMLQKTEQVIAVILLHDSVITIDGRPL